MSDAPIVVGVSGSAASRNAVEAAAREAAMHRCPLHVVHSFNWIPALTMQEVAGTRPAVEDLMRSSVATATRLAPGCTVTAQLVEGSAVTGLLRRARTAAMTVIGDGDLRSQVCLRHDSVAVQVAARAPGTVMVTRPMPPPPGPVLVGVNGSAGSEQALDFAVDEAACRGAGLVVVHAWGSVDGREPDLGTEPAALVRLVTTRADKREVTVRIRMVRGDPTTVLLDECRDAGLVVVGARGQRPYRGLLGSVAMTLLHHAPAPVVLVRTLLPGGRRPSASRPVGSAQTTAIARACARSATAGGETASTVYRADESAAGPVPSDRPGVPVRSALSARTGSR